MKKPRWLAISACVTILFGGNYLRGSVLPEVAGGIAVRDHDQLRPSLSTGMWQSSLSSTADNQLSNTIYAQAYMFRARVLQFVSTSSTHHLDPQDYADQSKLVINSLESIDGDRSYLHPSALVLANIGGGWIDSLSGTDQEVAVKLMVASVIRLTIDPSTSKMGDVVLPNPHRGEQQSGFQSESGFAIVDPSVPEIFRIAQSDEYDVLIDDIAKLVASGFISEEYPDLLRTIMLE